MDAVERTVSLKEIEKNIRYLPFLPTILSELMMMDKDDDYYYEKLLKLAKQDPPLTTFILRIANSAIAAPLKDIQTLEMALARIGTQTVVRALASMGVARVFIPLTEGHKALWWHSIETGVISRLIAKQCPHLDIKPDFAYICGLLHDIGRFVLLEFNTSALDETDTMGWDTPKELVENEKSLMGYDHAEVGYMACNHWRLPKTICNAVRAHHMYDIIKSSKAPHGFKNLVVIIQFADYISVMMQKHQDWHEWTDKYLVEFIERNCYWSVWSEMDFSIRDIVPLLKLAKEDIDKMAKVVGVN